MPASRLASQPPPTSRLATQLGSPASPATARQPADMLGSRPTRGTTPLRQLQPLPRAVQPGAGTSGAGASDDLPPSRIPAAFHVYAGRRRVFPSERPSGDAESLHLANALGGMLEQWRAKLEASKPSFPMGSSGSTLWGVVQMIVYDIWSTIEESRIWDTALLETQRQVCFYSPQLAAMLGRVRARIAQSFESILSMSQRLQYELQRWHAQWVHAGESLKQESSLRHGLQLQTGQLQAKVKQLENDGRIASVSLHPPAPKTRPSPCPLSVRNGAGAGVRQPHGSGTVLAHRPRACGTTLRSFLEQALSSHVPEGSPGAQGAQSSRGYEQTLRQLQAEVASLRKQLRAQQAQTTTSRGREVELRLTNEGLMEEVTRWKRQTHQEATAAQEQQVQQLFEGMGGAQQAELLQVLQATHTATHPEHSPAAASASELLRGMRWPSVPWGHTHTGLISGPPATAARPAVSATTLHTRVARPACPWRAGAPASTGERGPSLAKERLEVRESLHARTLLLFHARTLLLCALWCDRIAHLLPRAPPRHLDRSSTTSAQTRSPHCATNSTTLSAALYARRTQRQDRGRSPSATPCLLPGGMRSAHWVLPSRRNRATRCTMIFLQLRLISASLFVRE